MPDNDFVDSMLAPVDWGGPPSYWQGSSYPSSATNFAQMGGQRFGNIGAFAGMGMDAMLPQFRGMWDVRSAGGYGNMARAHQQNTMVGEMMQRMLEQQRHIADANMTQMGGTGYTRLNTQTQGMMKALVTEMGGSRYINPGMLSYQGMQRAYGAVANYGNQWTPSQGDLTGFHNAFQSYFYAGGKENLGRTSGLAADDVMAVTAEITRRGALKPSMFSEARRSQDEVFGKTLLTKGIHDAKMRSADILKELEASGGNLGDFQERLETRLRKAGVKDYQEDVQQYLAEVRKNAGGDVDIDTLRYKGGMGAATKYAQVFQGFKNAGFTGDFKQLMNSLEQQFGDAALNPDRMRAVQQKMAAIVDMTGKSLQEVSNLMTVIQSGPGARLSGERAINLAGIAAGAGAGIQGLTQGQQRELQMKMGNAITSTEKSPRALMEDILSGSADPALQALGKQLMGATGKQGKDMVRGLMAAPGQYGLTGATADAFKAIGMGDMRAAATMREIQDEQISRDMATYNNGGGKDAALRSRLEARGVQFNARGQAVGGPSVADRAKRAGADILGGLGQGAQDALRAAGAAFGITDAEKQLQMGAALGSLSNLGSQKPAVPALQEMYKQITGNDLTVDQALEMAKGGIGSLAKLGSSINAGYYQGAVDRASSGLLYNEEKAKVMEARARRTGALNTLGDVMMSKDIMSMVFGQEKISGAALTAQGLTKDAALIAGFDKLGALDDKGRQDVQLDIAAFNRLTAQLDSETNPEARGKLQAELEAKTKRLADRGISEEFLSKMSGDEGAALMGRIRDASNVNGKEREIRVFVTGTLNTPQGPVELKEDKQPNTTDPNNTAKPTK